MSIVLIVDDDLALCRSLELQLNIENHKTTSASDVKTGLSLLESFLPDIVLLDMNFPQGSGLEALPYFLAGESRPTVILMTADTDNIAAVEAMRLGAFDYLRKPFKRKDLYQMVDKVHRQGLQEKEQAQEVEEEQQKLSTLQMVGAHPRIIEIHKLIGLLARSRVTVLIQGKSGTGKELAARILHRASSPYMPFVAINCSAVVETLLESEFFGHEKGAFTGADKKKIGKFEYAGEGTVFLDEIGDMPLELQGKLLRVLQEGEFDRVGGLAPIPFKARIISATNKDLKHLVREAKFREDLYFRLSVSLLTLPPLRERREDIPLLIKSLLQKIGHSLGLPVPTIDQKALELLLLHDWPGNVRELENILTRAVALATEGVLNLEYVKSCFNLMESDSHEILSKPLSLMEAEKKHIEKILIATDWNISKSARFLDITRPTLRKKIQDYNLQDKRESQ